MVGRGETNEEARMEIPVLIEPVAGNGYRASGGAPFTFTVEAATREEALRKAQEMIAGRVAAGAELVAVSVPRAEHPWARFAGTLRNDPMLDAWKQAMADYRRKVDEDPDIP
jgi:predicted RNase H-like HicB family nuclease